MKRRTRRSQVESSPEKTPQSSPSSSPEKERKITSEKVHYLTLTAKIKQDSTEKIWSLFFYLVTVLSLITRLWNIHLPQEVV
jgi:hypothetical protein